MNNNYPIPNFYRYWQHNLNEERRLYHIRGRSIFRASFLREMGIFRLPWFPRALPPREDQSPPSNLIGIQGIWAIIGPGRTQILYEVYKRMEWNEVGAATRMLLLAVFNRDELRTHVDKDLDERKVKDIVHIVSGKTAATESEIRGIIKAKCLTEKLMHDAREKARKKRLASVL